MTDRALYPLTFDPVLKHYIWGGHNLATRLARPLPSDIRVAESWDIAAHANGVSTVNNGPNSGRALTDLYAELGLALTGWNSQWAYERDKFPLLIKILDAARHLSVQVHPNDAQAKKLEGDELGKTEMWAVLHAEPDAAVILGVTAGTTPEQFRRAIAEGNLEPHLHHIPVRAGDVVCVPAGSLHAILGGLLIAEIQQNSDTTYRVYDWNRVGDDGQPRPLHVDKALQVINFEQVEPHLPRPVRVAETPRYQQYRLCHSRYFVVERLKMAGNVAFPGLCDGSTLEIWGVVAGQVTVQGGGREESLAAVQFCLLPAGMGTFSITTSEPATLLRAYLPAGGENH